MAEPLPDRSLAVLRADNDGPRPAQAHKKHILTQAEAPASAFLLPTRGPEAVFSALFQKPVHEILKFYEFIWVSPIAFMGKPVILVIV